MDIHRPRVLSVKVSYCVLIFPLRVVFLHGVICLEFCLIFQVFVTSNTPLWPITTTVLKDLFLFTYAQWSSFNHMLATEDCAYSNSLLFYFLNITKINCKINWVGVKQLVSGWDASASLPDTSCLHKVLWWLRISIITVYMTVHIFYICTPS